MFKSGVHGPKSWDQRNFWKNGPERTTDEEKFENADRGGTLTSEIKNVDPWFESKTINFSVEKLPGEVDFFSIESSFSHSPSELLLDTVDTVKFVGSGVDVES